MPKNSFGKNLIEQVSKFDEESTSLDEVRFSTINPEELIFKYSIKQSLIGLASTVVFATILLTNNDHQEIRILSIYNYNWLLGIAIGILPFYLFIKSIIQIINRKTQAKINSSGIWTDLFELQWSEVVTTKIRKISGDISQLIICTSTQEFFISIHHFNIDPKKVSHMVQLYRNLQNSTSNN
ncbi:hypothetical protein [Reichenbachiella versicolor]|uniref:hypothetical protein n=1 Tax=Reichenbachiella versicolor TaxID=1821036 RepID=UPI000D6E9E3D|nr:hypothetical protein [Reichenbachiella versicolor]